MKWKPFSELYLRIRHTFKSFNMSLKSECLGKSKFTLSKVISEEVEFKSSRYYILAFALKLIKSQ